MPARIAEPRNVFTVDVEDYYQVEAFAAHVDRTRWNDLPSRVSRNTDVLLELLDGRGVKATFFVLGCVAEAQPDIVRRIHAAGHEIASHGYSHRMITRQQPEEFRQETLRGKAILEDLIGEEVLGYRAATYSVTRETLWALDVLVEAGFRYDSSIFPVVHDRYGIPDFCRRPCVVETAHGALVEFPITTTRVLGRNLPIAGGGYFRLFPLALSLWGLRRVNHEGLPFTFYIHPWEIDPGQPVIEGISAMTRFRHYVNLGRTRDRLDRLLQSFHFSTMAEVLEDFPLEDCAP